MVSRMLTREDERAIQNHPFPDGAECEHCQRELDGLNCVHDYVHIGDPDETYPTGLAHWLCCHACRDANDGEECETFVPVPDPDQ